MPIIHADDRFLWFIVGVGLFFAYKGASEQLRRVRKLTEITHDESQGKKLDQETEDAISLETLFKLASSSSHELRAAAVRIICDRLTRGPTLQNLEDDLASKNKVKRDRALEIALFILRTSALHDSKVQERFYAFPFLRALTQCLVNLLDEHKPRTNENIIDDSRPSPITRSSPVLPPNRPQAEKHALEILNFILPSTPHTALLAGLVSQWLAKYPFPCALEENGGRRDLTLKLFVTWYKDDGWMATVLNHIVSWTEGKRALKEVGYEIPMFGQDSEGEDDGEDDLSIDDSDGDILMSGGEDTAGMMRRRSRRRRPHNDSAEEQAIRRRRREAMVFSDGGGPLGQENIILRREDFVRGAFQPPTEWAPAGYVPGSSNPEVEEALARLNEEVNREMEAEENG